MKMSIYCGFMIEKPFFIGSVSNCHDIDIFEFGSGFAPVTMS